MFMGDKKDLRFFFEIIIRYLIVVVLGLGNLYLFYVVLTPLTLFGVGGVLGLFFDVAVVSNGFFLWWCFF